eukprot:5029049-Alexandrium_andersonii.AAC.1
MKEVVRGCRRAAATKVARVVGRVASRVDNARVERAAEVMEVSHDLDNFLRSPSCDRREDGAAGRVVMPCARTLDHDPLEGPRNRREGDAALNMGLSTKGPCCCLQPRCWRLK